MPASATELWIEAESPDRTDFPPVSQNPFRPNGDEEANVLSGGQWIGVTGEHGPLFLEYDVDVASDGPHRLYTRKFWKHGPYRWRITQGDATSDWVEIDRNVGLLDNATMRLHTGANWTTAGEVDLKQGPATIRIELTEDEGAAAFDALLLTNKPFTARGKIRPDQSYADLVDAPDGWFAFDPASDPDEAPTVDLRTLLNEPEAGSKGFIKANGDRFVHADTGEEIRFWGVNAGHGIVNVDNASVDYLARFLARRGVNLVRLHGATYPTRGSAEDMAVTKTEEIERIQYAVAAFKQQGIYVDLSIYFPLWVQLDASNGWAGYENQHPFGLLYWDPKFQELYRGWWRDLLTSENPYGPPLAKEPAIAFAEMVNEDSFFFYTFKPGNQIPSEQMPALNRLFARWLADKYGSTDAAIERWDGVTKGKIEVPDAARLAARQDPYAQDAAAFLTELQRDFYQKTSTFLKDDLGFGGMTLASNWHTASTKFLEPLEKHTYFAGDVTDRHGYYSGVHKGEAASHDLREGHLYADRAAPRFDPQDPTQAGYEFSMPMLNAVYGDSDGPKPSMISEFDWAEPNRYRADLPLITAGYGSLQGLDCPIFFALGGPTWQGQLTKWPVSGPDMMGQFPAFALAYRKNLIQAGPVVAEMTVGVDAAKALEGAPTVGTVNLDELRVADVPDGQTVTVDGADSIDPRAFLVGQVRYNVVDGGEPASVKISGDLAGSVDSSSKIAKSATGELAWDYGRGLITTDAPQVKAVTGFLGEAGTIDLQGVTISSPIEYGTVAIVALDDKPLSDSGLMLVQAMTEMTNFGWTTEDAGDGLKRITKLGGPPLIVKDLGGSITLPAGSYEVTPLAANLTPSGPATSSEGTIELSPTTLYYLVRRD